MRKIDICYCENNGTDDLVPKPEFDENGNAIEPPHDGLG